MQTGEEKASSVAASARAGMEKTKATVQEKVDKMKANDQGDIRHRKEERTQEAEADKQMTKEDNAEARAAAQTGEHYTTAGYGSGGMMNRFPVVGERIISRNTPAVHETGGRID